MRILTLVVVLIGLTSEVQGQKTLTIDGGALPSGDTTTVGVHIETDESLAAWSFGVCHDEGLLAVEDLIETPDLLSLLQGAPPRLPRRRSAPPGLGMRRRRLSRRLRHTSQRQRPPPLPG